MKRMNQSLWIVFLLAGLACLPTASGAAGGLTAAAEPVAHLSNGATALNWQPVVANYDSLVLTVSGPDGVVSRQEFKAGEAPSFALFDRTGKSRPDGGYTYELRSAPTVDPQTRARLQAYRDSGDRAILTELRQAGKLPPAGLVQSGSFSIQGGAFVEPDQVEPPKPRGVQNRSGKALTNTSALDQVIPDDLIVQGSACVGLDCVNNESFGFDTIRLKENNTRIKFEDTSVGTFPSNDWQLTANDSTGANKFSIDDITGARVPFTITAGAATNSIFVDSTGRLGLRTATPVLDIHVNTSNTPAMRLEQNNSGGFTAQTWDVGGNEANFFVRDVTGGSRLPFRVRPGAPTSSIDISSDGDVGIGTASPSNRMDIRCATAAGACGRIGNSSATGFSGWEFADESGTVVANFSVDNTGNTFRLNSTGNQPIVFLTESSERVRVTSAGSVGIGTTAPSSKLHVNGGDIRVSGGSFIDDGVTLNAPDYVFASDYHLMPLNELAAFTAREKHLPNVPSASDIKSSGLNLSQFQMRLLEKVEELTLYTLTQHEQITDLKETNAQLLQRLNALEARLAEPSSQK